MENKLLDKLLHDDEEAIEGMPVEATDTFSE